MDSGEKNKTHPNLLAILEAVLFAAGDPVDVEQIGNVLDTEQTETEQLLSKLARKLDERKSALTLQRVAGGYQLLTRPEYYFAIEKLNQIKEKKLSVPAMETLSIIAFKQPITKQEIEQIRGVHVDHALSKLLDLDLVVEIGRKRAVGHPILYGTTDVFLRSFGLNSLHDLPMLPGLEEVAAERRAEQLALGLNEEESPEDEPNESDTNGTATS